MRGFLIFQARYWLAIAAALYIMATIQAAWRPAHGQNLSNDTMVFRQTCVEQFKGLPALAHRLGVKPGHGDGTTVMLHTCAHGDYSLFAIINAVLDRLDRPKLDANGTKVSR